MFLSHIHGPVTVRGLSTHPIRVHGDYASLAVTPDPVVAQVVSEGPGTTHDAYSFHETMLPAGYSKGSFKYGVWGAAYGFGEVFVTHQNGTKRVFICRHARNVGRRAAGVCWAVL